MEAAAALSSTMEDYLETIYEVQREKPVVRVKDIARAMGVKMPSVTSALTNLKGEGLIHHEKYGYVELTEDGRRVAEQVRRRHVALAGFLRNILQLDPEQAEKEACELEHSISAPTLRRLLGFLEFVEGCPRSGGDWLTHMRGRWEDRGCDHDCKECIDSIEIPERAPFEPVPASKARITLAAQEPGFTGTITRVGGKGAIRRRLMEMGVTAGTGIELERIAPLGDPIEVKVRGYHLSLRKDEAANVYVEAN